MKIIKEFGYHLGVNCEDAYFIKPETEEEKLFLAEFIEASHKFKEEMSIDEG
jgi:hypothetical protein